MPGNIRELSDNGNLLALLHDFAPVVTAYNEDLFKQKHVAMPQDGWTWSRFMSDAKALTGGGTYGVLPTLDVEFALLWVRPSLGSTGARRDCGRRPCRREDLAHHLRWLFEGTPRHPDLAVQ